MPPTQKHRRLVKWELLRLPYNMLCVIGACLMWSLIGRVAVAVDELSAPGLQDKAVLWSFVLLFVLLNAAYCLIYAVEALSARLSARTAFSATTTAYIFGCILGLLITLRGTAAIGHHSINAQRLAIVEAEDYSRRDGAKEAEQDIAQARPKWKVSGLVHDYETRKMHLQQKLGLELDWFADCLSSEGTQKYREDYNSVIWAHTATLHGEALARETLGERPKK